MNESKIDKILSDAREVEKLLLLEKERRGVDKGKLVFVGMANVAKYYWCAMSSIFKSKERELEFFGALTYTIEFCILLSLDM